MKNQKDMFLDVAAEFKRRNAVVLEEMLGEAYRRGTGLYVENWFEARPNHMFKQEFRFYFTDFPPLYRMSGREGTAAFYKAEDISATVARCQMEGV